MTCAPITPPAVITGDTSYDRAIGFLETITGQQPFGLFDNWLKVPLSDLGSPATPSTRPTTPGIVDPSGAAFLDGFVNSNGNPFVGGTGPGDTMPWDGLTYTLNPLQPFVNFYDSLLQTPSGGIMPAPASTSPPSPTSPRPSRTWRPGRSSTLIPFTAGSGRPARPRATSRPACRSRRSSRTSKTWIQPTPRSKPG